MMKNLLFIGVDQLRTQPVDGWEHSGRPPGSWSPTSPEPTPPRD